MTKFHLKVVTPDKLFFEDEVENVIVRTKDGDRGILSGHISFLTSVGIGPLRIITDGKERKASISEGFVSVNKQGVNIITTDCQWVEDINVSQAEIDKKDLEEKMSKAESKEEKLMYKESIQKVNNLIKLGNK